MEQIQLLIKKKSGEGCKSLDYSMLRIGVLSSDRALLFYAKNKVTNPAEPRKW